MDLFAYIARHGSANLTKDSAGRYWVFSHAQGRRFIVRTSDALLAIATEQARLDA